MKHLPCNEVSTRQPGRTVPAILQSASPGWTLPRAMDDWKKIFFILDTHGRVRFFSAPDAFSSDDAGLIGHPIRQFVPDLPLRDQTPGYNIAFTRFSFADNHWRPYDLKMPDGSLRTAAVRIRPVSWEHGHCLLGQMRLRPGDRMHDRSGAPFTQPAGFALA